jgi:hypothetical protein
VVCAFARLDFFKWSARLTAGGFMFSLRARARQHRISLAMTIPLVVVAGCGGGGGGSSSAPDPVPQTPQSPSGIWLGTIQGSLVGDISCLIAETDVATCFVSRSGSAQSDVISGGVTVAVAQITVTGDSFGLGGGSFSLSGTIDERSSLDLTGDIGAYSGLTVSATYDTLYETDSSLATIEGVYSRASIGNDPASFSIDANGVLYSQAQSGCVHNGQVSVIDARYNAYAVAISVGNCGAADGDYMGLATYESASGTFKFIATSSTGAISGGPSR